MADPLGSTASLLTILHLAAGVGLYIRSVATAPAAAQALSTELTALQSVLKALQTFAKDSPRVLEGVEDVLRKVVEELERVRRKLGILDGVDRDKDRVEMKDSVKRGMERLRWPLREKETEALVQRVERVRGLCVAAMAMDQLALSKAIEAYTLSTDLAVQGLEIDAGEQKAWRQGKRFAKILAWLSPEDFTERHTDIREKRKAGTGQWLLKTKAFQAWACGDSEALLWGKGIPGAGKTFLSSVVIDHLLSTSPGRNGVAYVYFDYKCTAVQPPLMVLCSLLKQLVLQMPEFPNALEVLYDSLVKSEKRPGLEEIFALLVGGVRTAFESVYIVCDALDECDPQTQRSALLPLLKRMAAQGCRVLVTSRPHPEDIQDAFSEDAGKIELLAQAEDLRSYVQARIDSSGRARRIIRGSRYEDEIISELVSSAKGMFLLVQFHIDHLCQLTTVKQVRQELAKLKQDAMEERPLDPTYDRAVELLRSQGRFEVQLALKILLWITKAPRPLLVDELRIAVAIEAGEYELDYDEDIPSVSTLTDVCAGLVDIDENGKAIRLIHYTAQEYLVRKGIIPDSSTDPEFNIALSCITYLSFTAFSDGNTSIEAISSSPPNKNHTHVRQFLKRSPDTQHLLHTHPFLHYASTNLSFHLHQHPQSPATTTQAFLHFLSLPGNIATYFRTLTFQTREHYAFRGLESHPACVAAVIGHLPALLHLAAAATADHNGRTALSWAARHGHADIVNHLLRLTSPEDINAADSYHKTPLIHAAHFGNLEIVQALLQHGAAVDAKDLDGWTPLLWASQWGHEGVVRVLLDHGADPDVKDRAGWSALSWACKEGFGGVVRALLEKADVRRVDFPAAKPVLDWAAEKGESEVWEVLMRRWRQIEMVEGQM